MRESVTKHWFLIALSLCFTVGYFGASDLRPLMEMPFLRDGIVFAVMWMMGVTLQADTIRRSFTRPVPSLLAIAVNVLVVPLLCLPTMWLLPANLFGGLFVASIVPCTLASASVWTRKANGDDSIAMMTTVVTNLACVVVVPIGILLVLSQQTEIDVAEQAQKLSLVVVAPLVIAQLMRRFGFAAWADRNKPRISALGQIGILAMVGFGAIKSAEVIGAADDEIAASVAIGAMGVLVVLAATIHTLALVIGISVAKSIGLDRPRQIAVGIAGSQKTLMVGLQIAIDCGVSVIPMLVYHMSQLVIDTLIVERWRKNGAENAEEHPAGGP